MILSARDIGATLSTLPDINAGKFADRVSGRVSIINNRTDCLPYVCSDPSHRVVPESEVTLAPPGSVSSLARLPAGPVDQTDARRRPPRTLGAEGKEAPAEAGGLSAPTASRGQADEGSLQMVLMLVPFVRRHRSGSRLLRPIRPTRAARKCRESSVFGCPPVDRDHYSCLPRRAVPWAGAGVRGSPPHRPRCGAAESYESMRCEDHLE
jgi:hypothetical protein